MKTVHFVLIIACSLFWSCQENTSINQSEEIEFQNKGHELVYDMIQKVGTYQKLKDLKDVTYTYTYQTPDGKTDITTEKYIFDGELSYGNYEKHERTLTDLEGTIEQGYDGELFWIKNNGERLIDEAAMKRTIFNRKTNFYWFTMMQKLNDSGLNYEYLRADTIDGNFYDVVNVTFESEKDKPTDIYQLFINQRTYLVDQFLFTVVDFNIVETPFLMKVEYEEIDGILIPTKRKYTKATWKGENLNENWILVNWSNIQFNNGLSKSFFKM